MKKYLQNSTTARTIDYLEPFLDLLAEFFIQSWILFFDEFM